MKYSVRVKFTRGEDIKFISHLDIMKVFERALRRADIPIGYSKGFNPHPQLVIGLPLSVGVTSEAEYADFDFTEDTDPEVFTPDDFAERMNSVLPSGIRITEAVRKTCAGNIMSSITGAKYEIEVYLKDTVTLDHYKKLIKDLMGKSSIIVEREKKGKVKDIDVKPMIKSIGVESLSDIPRGYEVFESAFLLTATVLAGSNQNLRPDLLMKAISVHTGINIETFRIHRTALYTGSEGQYNDPLTDAVRSPEVRCC